MPLRYKSLWTDRPDDWLTAPDPEPEHRTEPLAQAPRPAAAVKRSVADRARRPLAVLAATAAVGGAYVVGTESGDEATGGGAAAALPAASGQLAASDINKIYAQAGKGVVSVQVASGGSTASGTGFVIDRKGTIVTNAHVVGNAGDARVRFDDGDTPVAADVVGTDPSTDLAVLRVDPAKASGVTPLALAESKSVQVGDAAIAIGYPLGLDRTATAGIVSGLEREIEAPNGFRIDEVIQTDAPINPGNSGGPLLDAQGRVIGVNSQIATSGGGGGSVGIGFAVPSDTVREVVPKLLAGESIARPWLGVATAPSSSGRGATVQTVTSGGPAERAGLRQGDVLTSVGGTAIADPDALAKALETKRTGDRVELEFTRGGQEQSVDVTLGTRPSSTP